MKSLPCIFPEDIESSPSITDTFQIHMVKRFFDIRTVCFLVFYHPATDNKPFFTQFYGEGGCAHQNNAFGDFADFAGRIIHPTNNNSSAQYAKYGLTNSVFTCENNI